MIDTLVIEERKAHTRCCDDAEPQLSTETAQQITDDLLLFAHPVRLQILDILARRQGQVCVCDLEAAVPVKQPTVSHHLRLLREAGLIGCERHGQWAYYFLKREALAAVRTRVFVQFDVLS
jgi:ArsR family transcriptional regulator, arsenate/arsenite/antimonite-responsive transcriptional repressor